MTRASALAFGGDGALWIGTIGGAFDGQPRDHGKLARLEPGSAAFETLETDKPDLTDMVTLPDGRIVMSQRPGFGEAGTSRLTVIDSAQRTLRDVPVATNVYDLSAAPDGSVWGHRSEPGGGQEYLVRLDPTAGTIRELPLGSRRLDFSTTYESAFSLAVAADGAVWYDSDPVDTTENLLVRFDPATGQSTRRSLPPEQGVATLEQLRFGPDGRLYFIRNLVNRPGSLPSLLSIGAFDPQSGSTRIIADAPVEEFSYVVRVAGKRREEARREPIPLFDFAFGGDGAIWFPGVAVVYRLDPARGALTGYPVPSARTSSLGDLIPGPGGELWFTEVNGGNVGRIALRGSSTTGSLGSVLAGGLGALVQCSGPCRATAELQAPAAGGATASASRRRRPRVVGRARTRLGGAARKTIKVRFSKRARRSLRHKRRVRLTLVTRTRARGRTRTSRRQITLRRIRPTVRKR